VLWGTLFPIISEAVRGTKITVGPPFFNSVNVPLGLGLLALTGIGPLIAWRRASTANLKRQFTWPVISGVVTFTVLFAMGMRQMYALVSYLLAGFVIGTIRVFDFVFMNPLYHDSEICTPLICNESEPVSETERRRCQLWKEGSAERIEADVVRRTSLVVVQGSFNVRVVHPGLEFHDDPLEGVALQFSAEATSADLEAGFNVRLPVDVRSDFGSRHPGRAGLQELHEPQGELQVLASAVPTCVRTIDATPDRRH
jgi:hypothetical protein